MEEKILKISIDNALYLLNELGEFYPFAYGLSQENQLVPVNIYPEDELPDSQAVVTELIKALKRSSADHNFRCVCICLDVIFTEPLTGDKTDAMQMLINTIGDQAVEYIIPYSKQESDGFIIEDDFRKTVGEIYFEFD